jgi:hypothetical protein
MKVTGYSFGTIRIDDKVYTSDVIITPEKVDDSWWRKEGHRLQIPDLDAVFDAQPDVLVVGTGYFGRMAVPEETRRFLQSKGIQLLDAPTGEAVKELNKLLEDNANAVAALHLTC